MEQPFPKLKKGGIQTTSASKVPDPSSIQAQAQAPSSAPSTANRNNPLSFSLNFFVIFVCLLFTQGFPPYSKRIIFNICNLFTQNSVPVYHTEFFSFMPFPFLRTALDQFPLAFCRFKLHRSGGLDNH